VVVVPPTDEMSDDVNLVSCKQGEQTLPLGRKCDRTLRIFAVVRSDKQGGLFGPLRHGSTCEVPEPVPAYATASRRSG
jgi:hypothetical protein